MSSEIYYDRAYIRVGDRFIPVVNHGSSNCFEILQETVVPSGIRMKKRSRFWR